MYICLTMFVLPLVYTLRMNTQKKVAAPAALAGLRTYIMYNLYSQEGVYVMWHCFRFFHRIVALLFATQSCTVSMKVYVKAVCEKFCMFHSIHNIYNNDSRTCQNVHWTKRKLFSVNLTENHRFLTKKIEIFRQICRLKLSFQSNELFDTFWSHYYTYCGSNGTCHTSPKPQNMSFFLHHWGGPQPIRRIRR